MKEYQPWVAEYESMDAEKMIENSREQKLLACYRKLNEEKQDAVLQNVKWLAE